MRFRQGVEIKEVCDSCFASHKWNKLVEAGSWGLPALEWVELPHRTCKCSKPDCGADQHLVPIDCVPSDSTLVAFVKVPPEWPGNAVMAGVYLPS